MPDEIRQGVENAPGQWVASVGILDGNIIEQASRQ